MALDFYIGCSLDMIQRNDVCVELNEELLEYIYQNRDIVDFDLRCLLELDPYSDTVLEINEIELLDNVCAKVLKSDLFSQYSKIDDAIITFIRLKEICDRAIEMNQSLICVGD